MGVSAAQPITYRFAGWRYESASRRLTGAAGEVRLKPLTDRLLRHLLDTPGVVLARETLIDQVWTRREVNDEVLSRAIAELRHLLGDDAREPRYIETLSKGGYRWITAVERAAGVVAQASPGQQPSPVRSMRGRRRWLGATIGMLLLGAAAGWLAWQRGAADEDSTALSVDLLRARPLVADPRLEYDARFDAMGRVVYVRSDNGAGPSEVVLVDPVSAAERVLWRDDEALRHPTPSPNGREVAVARRDALGCEIWLIALVDLERTRLGECAPSIASGMEWVDGGEALIHSSSAADPRRNAGLARLDRRSGTHRVLTTPEAGEGAHVDPRVSRDGTQLVYASRQGGEAQLWQAPWPQADRRRALLKRPEPVFGHAFAAAGPALWIAGDLTRYRALHRLAGDREPELLGGRDASSIDLAADGAAVWSEARYDADLWLRDGPDAPWIVVARSNRYESQPALSADGSKLALISNRNGSESVLVYERRDASVRALPLDPKLRWVRPTWSARDGSLIITAYEAKHTRLYRLRADGDLPLPLPDVETDAFHGVELSDRLVYLSGHGSGQPSLVQMRPNASRAEALGLPAVAAFRASDGWLVWRPRGVQALHAAPWPALQPVRVIALDAPGAEEAFTLTADTLWFVDDGTLWRIVLPDGDRARVDSERVPNGGGPNLAASDGGALAVVTLTALSIDLMLSEAPRKPSQTR